MDGLEAVLVPDLHLGYFQEWNHFFRADIIFDYFKAEIVGSDAADSASNKFPAAGLDHQNQVLLRFGRNDTEKSRELRLKKSAVEGEIEMGDFASRPDKQSPIAEIDLLWITAGLGCDGDTIAMTAATQPSIEDIVLGSMPWIPKVRLHNPFLAMENGEDFLKAFHLAAEGNLAPFILVVEGSIPNEHNKKEGYWAALGTDPNTGQPHHQQAGWNGYREDCPQSSGEA